MNATQVRMREEVAVQSGRTTTTNQEQQQLANTTANTKKKKTSHGNRKEYHRRRRMRRREEHQQEQMVTHHMDPIHESEIHSSQHHEAVTSDNKRKRQVLTPDDQNTLRSFSQLSVSQETQSNVTANRTIKKKKTTTEKTPDVSERLPATTEEPSDHSLNAAMDDNVMDRFKPQYLRVSNDRLKQMLVNAIPNGDLLVACLNSNEKLEFIRQMTEVTNQLQHLALQQQLWQDYFNIGIQEREWKVHVSKSYAKHHNVCRSYGYPQHTIEQRQQHIQCQIQRTIEQLQQQLGQLQQYSQQWEPNFDVNLVSGAIDECVKKGQHRLRQEFDYRRRMLTLNVHDHDLLKKFYQLQPNHELVSLAKEIWQTTAKSLKAITYEEILRKRIYLRRLPQDMDKKINATTDDIESLLYDSSIDKDERACLISDCSKAITQYKFDLMTVQLNAIEKIRHGTQQCLIGLRQKLEQSTASDTMKSVIEERIQIMLQRHEIYLKHKLQTFFDDAPTAAEH